MNNYEDIIYDLLNENKEILSKKIVIGILDEISPVLTELMAKEFDLDYELVESKMLKVRADFIKNLPGCGKCQ